jgi:endonuclease YncB( thermonuclease family)
LYEYLASLVSVHDGDTYRFDVDLGFDIHHANLDVRLAGFDCPELGRPDGLGEKAREFVIAWFAGHSRPYRLMTIRDHTEKYGRWLGVIHAGGADLAADLVQGGLAKPYSGRGPRPAWP